MSDEKHLKSKATWYAIRLIQDHMDMRWATNRSPLKRELSKVVESLEDIADNIWRIPVPPEPATIKLHGFDSGNPHDVVVRQIATLSPHQTGTLILFNGGGLLAVGESPDQVAALMTNGEKYS